MKCLCNLINGFICWLVSIFNSIVSFFINIDWSSNVDKIIGYISSKRYQNLSLELIGFEVTLIVTYFIFLPLIIENKDKEVYLGYRVSKWMLYSRNKETKFYKFISKFQKAKSNDMSIAWIISIFVIIISVLFYMLKFYLIIIVLFFLFVIFLSRKIIDYLNLTSSDEYKKEIENDFLEQCKINKEKSCDMLSTNKTTNVVENKNTLAFILQNYEKENVDYIYKYFYKELFNTNNIETIFMMFKEISNEIKRRNKEDKSIHFMIEPWDLNYLLINDLNDNNFKDIYDMLNLIIINNVEFTFKDINNYNELLSICYDGILKNNNISKGNKHRLLKEILNLVRYYVLTNKDDNTSLIEYIYVFNLFKYFIDNRDNFGIEFMIDILEDYIEYQKILYPNLIITLMIYLYYLIKIENPPYVTEEEKTYLNDVYKKLKNIISNYGIEYCYNGNVDTLFEWVKEVSHFWERYVFKETSSTCIKTPMCDNAIINSKRALYILFKNGITNSINKINDNDLDIFRYTIEDGSLKENILNNVNDFINYMGFTLEDSMIKEYVDSLVEYASLKRKEIKEEYNDIDYYIKGFENVGKDLYNKMSKLNIFNNTETKEFKEMRVPLPSEKRYLEAYMGDGFLKWEKLDNRIEKKILEELSNIKLSEIEYTYDTEKKIFNKLKSLKKNYYYIRPSLDNLGEEYKFGKEYLNTISKFNVIDTSVGNKRFIIDDYKCELKDLFFEIRELNEKELSKLSNNYKKGKHYYIKDDYGYEIKSTKNEVINYCKNKYISCTLVLKIGIDVKNSKGYEFVYKRKKLSK